MSKVTHFFHQLDVKIFSHPKIVLGGILLLTVFFAMQIPAVKMYSNFSDQLPQSHSYIQLHNEIKDNFGGANVIIVGVEALDGDVFTNETLRLIYEVTQAVDSLPGVNHNLVTSFTHRTTRQVWLTEMGNINSDPYYKPQDPALSDADLIQLKKDIVANPQVYGPLISPDMKTALIKAQLNEGELDYEETFSQLQLLRDQYARDGIKLYATGQPVLVGWAYYYKNQIFQILAFTSLIMLALLIFHFRSMYGVLVPLAGVMVSTIWGIGIISLFGYNLDPLGLVIPFLISARAMSHGIQLVERYYAELSKDDNSKSAARKTFESLFRPGSLGVVSDAIGLLLISVGSIPLNTKLAHYSSLWAVCIILTVLLAVPLLLSILPKPSNITLKTNALRKVAVVGGEVVSSFPKQILAVGLVVTVVGVFLASDVTIGESEPGSPILYQDHDYNISSKAINDSFPGSEELYIVAEHRDEGGIKRPEVLLALEDLERHMLLDPEVGGAKGVPDLIKQVNRLLHSDDPRWQQIPKDEAYVGGLMFAYMASSPIPGALKEFTNPSAQVANLVFFYKDHQGETIRRAIHTAKQWIEANEGKVDGLNIRLAGGTIGVTAAMNEAAFDTNKVVLPMVFALIFLSVMLFYSSFQAGLMMLVAMVFATTLTYAYMGVAGVGININTVPIIAVGVGVGIDYSIYMMDRIREEIVRCGDLKQAVKEALSTTGLAISFTALTLIAGIVMWIFMSDLRFQADAALLLSVMVVLNGLAALWLVPSWVLIFKPAFIAKLYVDEDGVIHQKKNQQLSEAA
jgi:predicted RND superfamily exporter protein